MFLTLRKVINISSFICTTELCVVSFQPINFFRSKIHEGKEFFSSSISFANYRSEEGCSIDQPKHYGNNIITTKELKLKVWERI